MAARHKRKAGGGGIAVAGGNPNVIEEAKERKKGGKAVGMHGGKSRMRLDRPGRKRGGRVGANSAPLSTAHSSTSPDAAPKSNSST